MDPTTVSTAYRRAAQKYKFYNDLNKSAKSDNLKIGDIVFVKWDTNNKYQPRFNPQKYKIVAKNGTMLTAERPGHSITRNSSFFKKASIQNINNIHAHQINSYKVYFMSSRAMAKLAERRRAIEANSDNNNTQQDSASPSTSAETPPQPIPIIQQHATTNDSPLITPTLHSESNTFPFTTTLTFKTTT